MILLIYKIKQFYVYIHLIKSVIFPIFWFINEVLFDPFISDNVIVEPGLPCEGRVNFPDMFGNDGFVGTDNGWNRTRFGGNVRDEFVFLVGT